MAVNVFHKIWQGKFLIYPYCAIVFSSFTLNMLVIMCSLHEMYAMNALWAGCSFICGMKEML
jgi:hypothetical protein